MNEVPADTEWMIRTSDNIVAGPYSRDQVRDLIREKQLGPHDEVCPANGHWILLQEREQIIALLGTDVAPYVEDMDEITQTQTETETDVKDQLAEQEQSVMDNDGKTRVAVTVRSGTGEAATIKRRSPSFATPIRSRISQLHVVSAVEPQGLWQKLRWGVLVVLIVALALFVFAQSP